MSSRLCETLLGCLVAVVALGLISCGGKASSEKAGMAAAADGGASSFGGAAGSGAPEPSTVHVSGSDEGIDLDATPECLQGFQGFSARMAGINVDFKAFVFGPGDYQGDPVQSLWLDALRANGEHYRAAAGMGESSGSISLHVDQVEPRFVGSLEAVLPAVNDPARAPLMLRLIFDIAARAGCP